MCTIICECNNLHYWYEMRQKRCKTSRVAGAPLENGPECKGACS